MGVRCVRVSRRDPHELTAPSASWNENGMHLFRRIPVVLSVFLLAGCGGTTKSPTATGPRADRTAEFATSVVEPRVDAKEVTSAVTPAADFTDTTATDRSNKTQASAVGSVSHQRMLDALEKIRQQTPDENLYLGDFKARKYERALAAWQTERRTGPALGRLFAAWRDGTPAWPGDSRHRAPSPSVRHASAGQRSDRGRFGRRNDPAIGHRLLAARRNPKLLCPQQSG